jgi:DNA-binding transcriptional ArsR family regulator
VISSVSTYLDVTRVPKRPSEAPPALTDHEPVDHSAKVLAAIHDGTETVTEIPSKAALSMEHVLAALSWLSEAGLVELDDGDGVMRARLTALAAVAMS